MSGVKNFSNLPVTNVTATILSGQTKSNAIDMSGATSKTFYLPSLMDGTELTFEVSPDNVTFYPYRNIDNDLVKITLTAGSAHGFAAIDFYSIQFFKIISNASESDDREIIIASRGI